MDLVKKIAIYMIGILALGLAAVIVAAGYLVLVPNSQVLGYHYIAGSMLGTTADFTDGVSTYQNIEVESHGFDIELYPQTNNLTEVEIEFDRNANGFTKEDIAAFGYSYTYDNLSYTIKIKVNEPYSGLIMYNTAVIKIGIPDTAVAKNIVLKSAGGAITLGQKTPIGYVDPLIFETSNITIINTRAEMLLQNLTMASTGTLDISNTSGITNISSPIAGDVIINTVVGSFNFGTEAAPTNIGGNLTIEANNAFVRAGNVVGNVSQIGASGLIKLKEVGEDVYINTQNGEIEIETVLKNIVIISEYNTIKIGNIGESETNLYSATINSKNGNIEIGDCYYELEVVATRGNITVLNAFYDATITTTYGDVNINYNASAPNFKMVGSNQVTKRLIVNTSQGNITATNLKTITELSVSTSGTATITAEFLEINGANSITGGRREFTVKVPVSTYTFTVATKSTAINILAGDAYKTSWQAAELVDGIYMYAKTMLGGSVTNTLLITSTVGKINVLTNDNA